MVRELSGFPVAILVAASLFGCSDSRSGSIPATKSPRVLGIADVIARDVPACDSSWECLSLKITCPEVSGSAVLDLHVGAATGTASLGTILFASGWAGDYKWAADWQPRRQHLLNRLRRDGFRVIQMVWSDNWWAGSVGSLEGPARLACRPATGLKWIAKNLHGPDSSEAALCATGHSNGASQLAYAVTQYDLGDFFDLVIFESGPNWSRLDIGCGDPRHVLFLPERERRIVDMTFGFGTLETASPEGPCTQASETGRLEESSLAVGGWDYAIPETSVGFLFGTSDLSSTRRHGEAFRSVVRASRSRKIASAIVPGADHWVGDHPAGMLTLRNWFLTDCRARP